MYGVPGTLLGGPDPPTLEALLEAIVQLAEIRDAAVRMENQRDWLAIIGTRVRCLTGITSRSNHWPHQPEVDQVCETSDFDSQSSWRPDRCPRTQGRCRPPWALGLPAPPPSDAGSSPPPRSSWGLCGLLGGRTRPEAACRHPRSGHSCRRRSGNPHEWSPDASTHPRRSRTRES